MNTKRFERLGKGVSILSESLTEKAGNIADKTAHITVAVHDEFQKGFKMGDTAVSLGTAGLVLKAGATLAEGALGALGMDVSLDTAQAIGSGLLGTSAVLVGGEASYKIYKGTKKGLKMSNEEFDKRTANVEAWELPFADFFSDEEDEEEADASSSSNIVMAELA